MTGQDRLGAWFWNLIGATFLAQTTVFAGRPMTSYRALELGAGSLGVGVVTACFAALPLVLAIPAGRAVDGARAVLFLRVGAACSLTGALVLASAGSLLVLALGNAVAGVGLLLSAIASQGIIARRADLSDHDRAFGLFTVAASAGQLVGPLASGLAADAAFGGSGGGSSRAGLLLAAGFAASQLLVCLGYRARPQAGEVPSTATGLPDGAPRVAGMLRTRGMPPALLSSLALLACVDLITVFLPVFAQERGISAQTVGWLLALRALASVASRLLVARLAARWGRRIVLVGSMVLAAVSLAALPSSPALGVLVPLMLVAGFTLGVGQPLTMSWVTGLVPATSRATALAVRLSGNRVGQVVVPATAGAIAGMGGAAGVFLLTAAMLSAASASVVVSGARESALGGE
ncbi:MFS transporter [Micromonospora sp. NPDC005163]